MIPTLLHALRNAKKARRTRHELRELAMMEPRILRDIGVTEGDIRAAMRRLGTWI
jgi:uncharacterized protein YjiS (DUF1127 family)